MDLWLLSACSSGDYYWQNLRSKFDTFRKFESKFESRIFVHTDASQAIGKIDFNINALNVDFVTVTGHKFYGPRIGALVLGTTKEVPLRAMFVGGNQERGKRAGYVISKF